MSDRISSTSFRSLKNLPEIWAAIDGENPRAKIKNGSTRPDMIVIRDEGTDHNFEICDVECHTTYSHGNPYRTASDRSGLFYISGFRNGGRRTRYNFRTWNL